MPEFTNGVWLVELAPLADPSLISQTIASVFGLREAPKTPLIDILTNYLRGKQLLLIFDNCEHLIAACAKLSADLLRVCPQLKIIASSREALGVSGEIIYRVPSLSTPDQAQVTREAIADYESTRLFVERAQSVQSYFALTYANASAVAQICQRLDGIPLALELAAARIAVFSPEEIASRLDDRFKLLTGGSRTALERHQTLSALIDWSYHLLSDEERRLFRQLSVFAGGWTFDAAEAVCSGLDVLNLLTQLVNKSLVMVDKQGERTRYRLPETIRQYARDKLHESREAEQARDHHLYFFLCFAEIAESKLRSSAQIEWLNRVETEYDNLRTALAWSLESGKSKSALRLAGALGYFWQLRGMSEGIKWLEDALAFADREPRGTAAEKAQSAKALYGVGRLRWMLLVDAQASRMMVEESLELWRELGDKWWTALALEHLGYMFPFIGDMQTGVALFEESVSLARETGDPWLLARCLVHMAAAFGGRLDTVAAHPIAEEAVALARRVGDKSILSEGLGVLVSVHFQEGDLTASQRAGEERLAEARAIGDFYNLILSLGKLSSIACLQGDLVKARAYYFQVLDVVQETGVIQWLPFVPMGLGIISIYDRQLERGVRLLSAALKSMNLRGVNLTVVVEVVDPFFKAFKQAQEMARVQLGDAAFQAAWAEGQQMTPEQALALAMEDEDRDSLPKSESSSD